MIRRLGLYRKRAKALVDFSRTYLDSPPWRTPAELKYFGKYADDSYRLFCLGGTSLTLTPLSLCSSSALTTTHATPPHTHDTQRRVARGTAARQEAEAVPGLAVRSLWCREERERTRRGARVGRTGGPAQTAHEEGQRAEEGGEEASTRRHPELD
jgi:hypothetical protein